MTATFTRRRLPAASTVAAITGGAALILAALGAGVALDNARSHSGPPAAGYVIYDHPQEYWVFANRHEICGDAQTLVASGQTLNDVIDANVVTFNESGLVTEVGAQQYLRGLLAGCVRY